MASLRTVWVWVAVVCIPAACTVVANNRLADKPLMGATGGGGAGTGGDVGTTSTGGEHEGGTMEAPLQAIGTPCGTDNSVCASGSCVDGVCCDQACVGDCFSCNEFGLFGTCTIITGEQGDCMSGEVCDATGNCIVVEDGACTTPANCATAVFCSDGVCCNEACDGPCESCAMADTGFPNGVCAALEDDTGECSGDGCFAKGQCCGDAEPATGSGCPAPCTSCNGSTCTILCDEENECLGLNLVCPQGYDCDIDCTFKHACRDAVIDCPAGHRCDLLCDAPQGEEHACEDGTLTCTDGPCAVTCTGDRPCKALEVNCGTNACGIDCVNAGTSELPPPPECEASCDCTDTCN